MGACGGIGDRAPASAYALIGRKARRGEFPLTLTSPCGSPQNPPAEVMSQAASGLSVWHGSCSCCRRTCNSASAHRISRRSWPPPCPSSRLEHGAPAGLSPTGSAWQVRPRPGYACHGGRGALLARGALRRPGHGPRRHAARPRPRPHDRRLGYVQLVAWTERPASTGEHLHTVHDFTRPLALGDVGGHRQRLEHVLPNGHPRDGSPARPSPLLSPGQRNGARVHR